MKLLPPEPDIVLYETQFGDDDYFERRSFGDEISALIQQVDDPFVLSIDAQWGSGKTFFLKRWVASHYLKSDQKHQTIYFDAFEHDFLQEPLLSLTSSVLTRYPSDKASKGLVKKAKSALAKFAVPATRIGLAALTAGATEITGSIVDAALTTGSAELEAQVEKFWQKEAGKISAMHEFRSALKGLAAIGGEGGKLVVVVDELDRCRPDYALSVLEVIKHFFNVPNVVFVLGVNMRELENMVFKRYGERTNASDYLRKFITLTASLPDRAPGREHNPEHCLIYLHRAGQSMEIEDKYIEIVARYLKRALLIQSVTIRSVQRILSEMVLIPMKDGHTFSNYTTGYQELVAALITMKVLNPKFYGDALKGTLTINQVYEWFSLEHETEGLDNNHDAYVAHLVFGSCLTPEEFADNDRATGVWGGWGLDDPKSKISDIARNYVEKVKLA